MWNWVASSSRRRQFTDETPFRWGRRQRAGTQLRQTRIERFGIATVRPILTVFPVVTPRVSTIRMGEVSHVEAL